MGTLGGGGGGGLETTLTESYNLESIWLFKCDLKEELASEWRVEEGRPSVCRYASLNTKSKNVKTTPEDKKEVVQNLRTSAYRKGEITIPGITSPVL